MTTSVTYIIVLDAQRLWTAEDIAHYIRNTNPSAVIALPGFPEPIDLKGVRGPRWSPRRVIEFFDNFAQPVSEESSVQSDTKKRGTLRSISPRRLEEIVGGT